MQPDHNLNGGRGASLSRRKFFQIAAASTAATLPVAASAAVAPKLPRLTSDEATLVDLINRHALVSSRRFLDENSIQQIFPSLPPFPAIKVSEVVDRSLDYPPHQLSISLDSPRAIDIFFCEKLAASPDWISEAYVDRIGADHKRARSLLKRRRKAFDTHYVRSGLKDLEEGVDRLYQEQDQLEKTICGCPCSSPRMAAIKAKFAADNITARIPTDYESTVLIVDTDALLLVEMLKSMLPLMEEP